jgi:hypothetical protein
MGLKWELVPRLLYPCGRQTRFGWDWRLRLDDSSLDRCASLSEIKPTERLTMTRSRFIAPLSCLAGALVCIGLQFSLQCTELKTVTPIIAPAGACIVGQLMAGNEDPLTIAALCAGVVIDDIISVTTAIEASQAEAGTPDTGSVSPVSPALVERVRAKAIALKTVGKASSN